MSGVAHLSGTPMCADDCIQKVHLNVEPRRDTEHPLSSVICPLSPGLLCLHRPDATSRELITMHEPQPLAEVINTLLPLRRLETELP